MSSDDDDPSGGLSRRGLLQLGGITAAAIGVGGVLSTTAGLFDSPTHTAAGMITKKMPGSDVSLPAVGLGTFQTFDAIPEDARATRDEVVRRFWTGGGRVVDVSPLYGLAEENLARYAVSAGIQNDLFLTNKIWSTGDYLWDESHADRSLRASMQKLSRTTPFDVVQCHSLVNAETVVPILHAWKGEGPVSVGSVSRTTIRPTSGR